MTRQLFQTMAAYNAWMNQNIYAGCAKIPDADRKKDMGAFFQSIYGTLNHLIVDDMWMFVMHMFNHHTHHRGQLTTLMKQCGIDPGPTDLPAMPH